MTITRNIAVDLAEVARRNGGFTYRPHDATHVSSGYAVSLAGHEQVIQRSLSGNDVAQHWQSHRDAFTSVNHCLGAWYNGTTDAWYLDLSIVVDSLDRALDIARAHSQLAVYDIANGETIPLDHYESFAAVDNPHPGALNP